ncbi:MAG: LCP family protein [Thermoleophilaceae bacterium]
MNDPGPGQRPEYKVYRSGRRPLESLRPGGGLKRLRKRSGRDRLPRKRRSVTPRRVLRWIVWSVLAWLGLSLVLFIVSAQIQKGVSDAADAALAGGGNMITGSTVLVLGSDRRTGDSIDESQTGPSRADSILLLRAGFGRVRKLSIPRDSAAEIPGRGTQKINAAYAFGGAGLAIETVEGFLGNGLEVNHVVEVDFADFPGLIDALGGITVNNRTRICAPPFDNFFRGFRLRKGKRKLDGRRALGFARVRQNACAPAEDDRARAARQQEVLTGIRGRLLSPVTFLRLPWVSWQAPKTIESDMGSAGLFGLFTDLITGNSEESNVLPFTCGGCGPGGSALVADSEKREAVDELLGR